ncbi:MAG: NAD(P)-dependent oxidoreductase [Hyphomicrobiaceae bacterium]|nr:NAD(P)-dependent oxidoreductase [Hyphomicrobiaceae bacterium]
MANRYDDASLCLTAWVGHTSWRRREAGHPNSESRGMHVGIAGVGKMGAAIALRLMDVGHDVTGWNRTAGRAKPLADAGARVAATPAALAGSVDCVITILGSVAAWPGVYDGPDGLLAADLAGKLVIDMTTVQPSDVKALAAKVEAKGAAFVECPVGGTVAPARQGKLLGLAGGEPAAFARAKPLLDQLCRRLEHLGPVGSGAAMKLAVNLPLMVAYQALAEAVILARSVGLSNEALMELLSDTSGAPTVLKSRHPAIAKTLGGEDPGGVNFDVDLICKDLRTMVAEAAARGATLPVASAALATFEKAQAEGWGPRDGVWLPAYWSGRQGR